MKIFFLLISLLHYSLLAEEANPDVAFPEGWDILKSRGGFKKPIIHLEPAVIKSTSFQQYAKEVLKIIRENEERIQDYLQQNSETIAINENSEWQISIDSLGIGKLGALIINFPPHHFEKEVQVYLPLILGAKQNEDTLPFDDSDDLFSHELSEPQLP